MILFQAERTKSESSKDPYVCGEHIACFWYEDNNVRWYLGIVEEIMNENLLVSYLTQDDRQGISFFLETAEVLQTSFEQIPASKIVVKYSGTIQIRCKISDKTLVTKLNDMIQEKIYTE